MKPEQQKQNLSNYFGLVIEMIYKMDNYSMIRFRGRKSIVETADLVVIEKSQCAA